MNVKSKQKAISKIEREQRKMLRKGLKLATKEVSNCFEAIAKASRIFQLNLAARKLEVQKMIIASQPVLDKNKPIKQGGIAYLKRN